MSECPDVSCRLDLDAALREIGRLRRSLVRPEEVAAEEPRPEPPAPDPRAQPPQERKAYAPDPIGKPAERRDATPPDPSEAVRVLNFHHVTNLGEHLDVLI